MKLEEIVALLGSGEPLQVLEAVGRLVLLGRPLPQIDVAIELGIGELEEDAYAALDALAQRDIEALRRSFAARDAVELRRIGAEAILGHAPALTMDEEVELVAFEEALRPHLWRLTALNEWRSLEVSWMTAGRDRFWWWSEGSEIDPTAIDHLDAVAELVAHFPEAELRLKQLAATELLMRQRPNVVELRAWIRARPLALAASTGAREQVLLEHPSFTLSLLPPDVLLVDLLEAGGPPRLMIGGATIESTPVPDAIERYRFELDALPERAVRAELVLSLSSGEVRVLLPPD
jgi:hypothetical protein